MRTASAVMTVVAVVVLGAAVNVGIAWGCALWSPFEPAETLAITPGIRAWAASGPVAVEIADDSLVAVSRSIGLRLENLPLAATIAREDVHRLRGTRTQAGWPMLAMEGSMWSFRTPDRRRTTVYPAAIQMPRQLGPIEVRNWGFATVPLKPVWLGFAVNTAFFSTIVGGMAAALIAARRLVRRRRGQCASCAYPLKGLATCPECGQPGPSPLPRP